MCLVYFLPLSFSASIALLPWQRAFKARAMLHLFSSFVPYILPGKRTKRWCAKKLTASLCSEQARADDDHGYCRFTPEIASRVIGKAQLS